MLFYFKCITFSFFFFFLNLMLGRGRVAFPIYHFSDISANSNTAFQRVVAENHMCLSVQGAVPC